MYRCGIVAEPGQTSVGHRFSGVVTCFAGCQS